MILSMQYSILYCLLSVFFPKIKHSSMDLECFAVSAAHCPVFALTTRRSRHQSPSGYGKVRAKYSSCGAPSGQWDGSLCASFETCPGPSQGSATWNAPQSKKTMKNGMV